MAACTHRQPLGKASIAQRHKGPVMGNLLFFVGQGSQEKISMVNSPALYKYCTYGGTGGEGTAWLDQEGSEGEKKKYDE